MDWQQGLQDAWSNVASFVPKLERVGFDRAVERGGLRRALARSKYDPSDILAKIVYWGVVLFTLQMAFGVFGPNPISDLLRGVIAYLPNVFVAILIVVIVGAIAKAVADLLANLLGGVSFGRQLAVGAGAAVMVLGAFAALDQLQIAPRIINGLWYALLAVVVGSAVVAFGGGGIPVARRYLERAADQADTRASELRARLAQDRSQPQVPGQAAVYEDPLRPEPGARRRRG
jgi:hypothetical protein